MPNKSNSKNNSEENNDRFEKLNQIKHNIPKRQYSSVKQCVKNYKKVLLKQIEEAYEWFEKVLPEALKQEGEVYSMFLGNNTIPLRDVVENDGFKYVLEEINSDLYSNGQKQIHFYNNAEDTSEYCLDFI